MSALAGDEALELSQLLASVLDGPVHRLVRFGGPSYDVVAERCVAFPLALECADRLGQLVAQGLFGLGVLAFDVGQRGPKESDLASVVPCALPELFELGCQSLLRGPQFGDRLPGRTGELLGCSLGLGLGGCQFPSVAFGELRQVIGLPLPQSGEGVLVAGVLAIELGLVVRIDPVLFPPELVEAFETYEESTEQL